MQHYTTKQKKRLASIRIIQIIFLSRSQQGDKLLFMSREWWFYSSHKTRCMVFLRMRNVAMSSMELHKVERNHTSNSCRKQLENDDNPSVLNLALPRYNVGHKVLLIRKRQRNGFCSPLPPCVGVPVVHVTLSSHQNVGSNVWPHRAFLEEWIVELQFRMLPFDHRRQTLKGNIRRSLQKYASRTITIPLNLGRETLQVLFFLFCESFSSRGNEFQIFAPVNWIILSP